MSGGGMDTPDSGSERERSRLLVLRVTLAGLVIALCVVALGLARGGGADWFVHLGQQSPALPVAREVLGADVAVPLNDRHDGETFWVLARDPALRNGKQTGTDLDRPAYRAQRILYPWLASPWRLGGEQALLWGLIVTNVVAVVVGSYALTRFALLERASWKAGLAFALNPMVIVALLFDVSDAVALAALVVAVLAVRQRWLLLAVLAAVIAVLAKESSLFGLVAVALFWPRLRMSFRVALVAVPAVTAGVWALYARWRLGWPPSQIQEFTLVPFKGFVDAYRRGWKPNGDWGDAVLALLVLIAAVVVVVRWWKRRSHALSVALPYALLVPFLSIYVIDLPQNAIRAIGPALSFLVVDLYAMQFVAEPRRAAVAAIDVSSEL